MGLIRLLGSDTNFAAVEFLGSEPKFAEPTAHLEGAVRCTAAKLVSDPNNSKGSANLGSDPKNRNLAV